MTRDPLDLLQSADPVPQPIAYSDDEVARRVAEIIDNDGHLPTLINDASTRPHNRWLAAGLVAAAVLVLAVVSTLVFARGNDRNDAAGASPVTCAVSTSGGSHAADARLKRAEVVIRARVQQLGGSAGSFVTDPGDGSIGFTPRGVSVVKAGQACRATTVAVRPLIARPVAVDTRAPRSSNPLAALTFAVPPTDVAYARLSTPQRTKLADAMSHYDCTHPTAATAAGLVCSFAGGSTDVFLLGPTIVSRSDVRSAKAIAPDPAAGGIAEWTVQLSFRPAGAKRLQTFTSAYHSGSTTATLSTCGNGGPVPCADFLAFTVRASIDSVPLTTAPIAADVQLAGAYDQASAQSVAADYTAASIQLHPR